MKLEKLLENAGVQKTNCSWDIEINGIKMIVSAGLGDAYPILRLNNCPEISVVEIN